MSNWIEVCALDDIAPQGSRVVASSQGNIAIFRTADDKVFGLHDKCPHKGGPLSQGMLHGETVTCPLHNWKIGLKNGEAVAPDKGCAKTFDVKLDAGSVWLKLN
jgi:nitrite reductase (NADH) small subunit